MIGMIGENAQRALHLMGQMVAISLLVISTHGCQTRGALSRSELAQPHSAPGQELTAIVQYSATILMTDQLTFSPDTVFIKSGQTVLWRNLSQLTHTVTADSLLAPRASDVAYPQGATPFTSGNIRPEQEWSHTFTTPGTYRYFSIPHAIAGMNAVIVVEPR